MAQKLHMKRGDEAPGTTPADIIFVITSKPHEVFSREGDDLIATCPITLQQAISGFSTSVTHLDGRVINFRMDNASPETTKTIPGDGKNEIDINFCFVILFCYRTIS